MTLLPGARVGAYEVLSPLGRGGMGEVYRARDTRLKRNVALKILPESFAGDPDRLGRFQREAEVLASLNHPHIAQIYGLVETFDVPVFLALGRHDFLPPGVGWYQRVQLRRPRQGSARRTARRVLKGEKRHAGPAQGHTPRVGEHLGLRLPVARISTRGGDVEDLPGLLTRTHQPRER